MTDVVIELLWTITILIGSRRLSPPMPAMPDARMVEVRGGEERQKHARQGGDAAWG
jgi:hypothetical protein